MYRYREVIKRRKNRSSTWIEAWGQDPSLVNGVRSSHPVQCWESRLSLSISESVTDVLASPSVNPVTWETVFNGMSIQSHIACARLRVHEQGHPPSYLLWRVALPSLAHYTHQTDFDRKREPGFLSREGKAVFCYFLYAAK